MIDNIIYRSQENENYCNPCCMSMILSTFGKEVSPIEIAKVIMRKSITNGMELAGTSDVCSEISHHGVYPMAMYDIPEKQAWEFLKNCVDNGTPVFVLSFRVKL